MIQRGDIWLVDLNPTAGHEQRGTRPVMVVSPAAFNELTGTPIVVPITTGGNFAQRRGFTVSLDDEETRTRGVVRRAHQHSARGTRPSQGHPPIIVFFASKHRTTLRRRSTSSVLPSLDPSVGGLN